jgi:hypothetical protein
MQGGAAETYSINHENTRWRVVDGEAVVIHLASTHYYGLNRTGTYLWNLLLEGERSLEELAAVVAARYAQPLEVVAIDIRGVLDDLVREDLLVRRIIDR